MKKNIYAIIFSVAAFFTANAQSLQIIDTTGGVAVAAQPSFTVNIDAYTSDGNDNGRLFYIKNTTSSNVNMRLKSYVLYNPGNIEGISYCIGTQCHTAGMPANSSISIAGNTTFTTSTGGGLLLDFTDYNGSGYAQALYTIYNAANANDSTSITITYNIVTSNGIKQNTDIANNVSVYPNPATNNISVAYDLKNSSQQATLKIYNTLGTLVKTTTLENYTSNKKIDVSSLDEGVYFYSVTVDGKTVKSSRLVVAR